MKRWLTIFATAFLILLSACQQAPPDVAATVPPDMKAKVEADSGRLKMSIPMKDLETSEEFAIEVDAKIYYAGYDSAPSYVCLPMEFGDTEKVAQFLFGSNYSNVQRIEDRDTGGIKWPYQTELLWYEEYRAPDNGHIDFVHSLGNISGGFSSGVDFDSIPNMEKWATPGDADGDGRASGMKRSREECQAQAQGLVDALGLDMILVRTDVLDVTAFQNYRFYFAHSYDGIPSSIGVNNLMRNYSWGQSLGEYLIICVCDNGIYKVDGMLYQIIETGESQPLISAEEAAERLIEFAYTYPIPVDFDPRQFTIDSVSLVYLPQAVEGDGVDVVEDGRGGGLMRNMIPAWQFSTGYCYGRWSAYEFYIDARTGEYLK